MKPTAGSLLAALLAAILPAPALAQQPGALAGDAIRALVSGRSASWVNAEGRTGTIRYSPDGTIAASVKIMGMTIAVAGTWEVKGDQFCRTIRMDPTPTRCQSVVPVSGKIYRFYDAGGKLATTTTFD